MHLATIKPIVFLLFALAVSGPAAQAQAGPEEHEHHAATELALSSADGARWVTDASLRQGMEAIRAAFLARLPGFRDQSLESGDYQALAGEVQQQLDFMFSNCDLPPAADAELHKLLAFIIGAIADLRTEGRERNGMVALHRALDAYGEYFDHPGWGG
jgi:hypothetical protein